MNFRSRRHIVALLLLFVTVTGLMMSFGEAVLCGGEMLGAHDSGSAHVMNDAAHIYNSSCHSAPTSKHSAYDHFCTGDCGCPCQAPLISAIIVVSYTPQSAILHPAEVTRHTPEVYLSLFVPPDATAV
jgi:hypothetical protein